MDLAYIPSPSRGVIYLGPIPLRGYALCIIIGVFVAAWIGGRRWVARGGQVGTVADIAFWAVLFGLVGGRLYHVITSYELYFAKGKNWVDAFKIWEGGLGIWGAIALGAVGAWIGCRRRGIPLPAYADAVAPGIAVAQAIGRWGNWFNQELFGKPTDLPWGLRIDPDQRPSGYYDYATFHPTFLYESLWALGVAGLVFWVDRRFRLGHGRAFALYVAAYTVGRFWIEYLRIDEAHRFLGLRLNDWTSIVVFLGAVACFVVLAKLRPGREAVVEPAAVAAEAAQAPGAAEGAEGAKDEGEPEADGGGGAGGEVAGAGGEAGGAGGEAGGAGGEAAEPAEPVELEKAGAQSATGGAEPDTGDQDPGEPARAEASPA